VTPVTTTAVVILAVWGFLNPFLEPGSREAEEGARSYNRGAWEESLDHYGRARLQDADPDLDYNLGASAYRAGRFEEAAEAFTGAQGSPRLESGRPAYNLGNARYMAGDYEGALEAYREALRADPANEDARYNYELALHQLESGAPPPQQQPDQGESGDDDQEPQDQEQDAGAPPDSSGPSENEPEPGAGDQENQGEEPPPAGQGEEEDDSPSGEESEEGQAGEEQQVPDPDRLLTAEEARQLLNQITPEERELLESRLKSTRRRQTEKDW